jgi:deoxycytidine triphosphate deaminase
MFLLSERLIRRYMEKKYIQIAGFDARHLYPTCYYFRLGKMAGIPGPNGWQVIDVQDEGAIVIPPHSVARVESLEHFTMSETTLAFLGNITDFPRVRGLQLLHGPTIDPGWGAVLGLAIRNMTGTPVRVEYGTRIGKAMFFDISDSALEEARLAPDAQQREQQLQQGGGN